MSRPWLLLSHCVPGGLDAAGADVSSVFVRRGGNYSTTEGVDQGSGTEARALGVRRKAAAFPNAAAFVGFFSVQITLAHDPAAVVGPAQAASASLAAVERTAAPAPRPAAACPGGCRPARESRS